MVILVALHSLFYERKIVRLLANHLRMIWLQSINSFLFSLFCIVCILYIFHWFKLFHYVLSIVVISVFSVYIILFICILSTSCILLCRFKWHTIWCRCRQIFSKVKKIMLKFSNVCKILDKICKCIYIM